MEKVRVYIDNKDADLFEEIINAEIASIDKHEEIITIKKTGAKGQSEVVEAISTIIITLGGGYGISLIVKELTNGIAKIIEARRSTVEINVNGNILKFDNSNTKEIVSTLNNVLNK